MPTPMDNLLTHFTMALKSYDLFASNKGAVGQARLDRIAALKWDMSIVADQKKLLGLIYALMISNSQDLKLRVRIQILRRTLPTNNLTVFSTAQTKESDCFDKRLVKKTITAFENFKIKRVELLQHLLRLTYINLNDNVDSIEAEAKNFDAIMNPRYSWEMFWQKRMPKLHALCCHDKKCFDMSTSTINV